MLFYFTCYLTKSYPYSNSQVLISSWSVKEMSLLQDFSLRDKAATLIFISGRGAAISSAKEGKSGFIYNLVKS